MLRFRTYHAMNSGRRDGNEIDIAIMWQSKLHFGMSAVDTCRTADYTPFPREFARISRNADALKLIEWCVPLAVG